MERNSRLHRWFGTSSRPNTDPEAEAPAVVSPGLDDIRQAMLLAAASCSPAHRLRAADQIRHARSAVELWLMRAEIFLYLAQDVGQMEAVQQLARLTPLFTGLVPGIAGHPKSLENRGHERRLH